MVVFLFGLLCFKAYKCFLSRKLVCSLVLGLNMFLGLFCMEIVLLAKVWPQTLGIGVYVYYFRLQFIVNCILGM